MLPTLIDDPRYYDNKILTPEEILSWFDLYECGWTYDGEPDPKKPHAELSGGECSTGYFNCRDLFSKNPRLCAIFADQLVRKLSEAGIAGEFNWVLGSSYSAITFSYEVAKILRVSHGFTEKDPNNSKKQIWKGNIPKGAKILQVEELITTSGTFREVRRAVEEEGNLELVEFLSVVGTLIHRPKKLLVDYDGIEVLALVEMEVWAGDPNKCPLCKIGSPRYRPKGNWAKLTGKA